jgi:branched-chain amino acid transport system permease protein
MDTLVIQTLNSIFYAAVLFLIAAGLSLIYGVMRIVNLAHGTFYALGAYVSAWAVGTVFGLGASGSGNLVLAGQLLLLPLGAIAVAAVGAVIEPTLLRPLYRRPEEYVLLITFGMLMILEDAMKFLFGGTPLSAGSIMDSMGSIRIGRLLYPSYNLVVIGVGIMAASACGGSSTARASASSCAPRRRTGAWPPRSAQCRARLRAGLRHRLLHGRAGRRRRRAGPGRRARHGRRCAHPGLRGHRHRRLGSLEGALVGALIVGFVRTAGIQFFAEIELAVLYLIAAASCSCARPGCSGGPDHARRAHRPIRPVVLAVAVPVIVAVRGAAAVRRPLPDRAAHLRAHLRHRRARLQSAARLHGPVVVRAFRLFRHGRLHGGVHRARPARQSMELCILAAS